MGNDRMLRLRPNAYSDGHDQIMIDHKALSIMVWSIIVGMT